MDGRPSRHLDEEFMKKSISNPNLILFLERKSIKKNFNFGPKPIAIPRFPPGNDIALIIEE